MERVRPAVCNTSDLKASHTKDYIKQLDNYEEVVTKIAKEATSVTIGYSESHDQDCDSDEKDYVLSDCHGLSYDCSPWQGIKNYVCAIAGATMTGCDILCKASNKQEVVLNWCGGWHHAQSGKAEGTSFASSKRVFCLSFHQWECVYNALG